MTSEKDLESATAEFDLSDKYRVYHCLGKGAYGKVYHVHDKQNNRRLAAKVVAKMTVGESDLWRYLRHPNILSLIRTDKISANCIVYLMPYVGKDLFSVLYEDKTFHSNRRCFARKRRYVLDVLRGLSYLHCHSLCHLDLKEENVLVCNSTDTAVIADFSTLSSTGRVTGRDFGLMKLNLPPEVASSRGKAPGTIDAAAAEMWTYGILVLQVFTRQCLARGVGIHSSYDEDILPRVMSVTGQNETRQTIVALHRRAFEPTTPRKEPLEAVSQLLDFVDRFLVVEPYLRYSAPMALLHRFLTRKSPGLQRATPGKYFSYVGEVPGLTRETPGNYTSHVGKVSGLQRAAIGNYSSYVGKVFGLKRATPGQCFSHVGQVSGVRLATPKHCSDYVGEVSGQQRAISGNYYSHVGEVSGLQRASSGQCSSHVREASELQQATLGECSSHVGEVSGLRRATLGNYSSHVGEVFGQQSVPCSSHVNDDVASKLAMLSINNAEPDKDMSIDNGYSITESNGLVTQSVVNGQGNNSITTTPIMYLKPDLNSHSKPHNGRDVLEVKAWNPFSKAPKRYWCTERDHSDLEEKDDGIKRLCFNDTWRHAQISRSQLFKTIGKYTGFSRVRNMFKPAHHFEAEQEPTFQFTANFSESGAETVRRFTAKKEPGDVEVQKRPKRPKTWLEKLWRRHQWSDLMILYKNQFRTDSEMSFLIDPTG